MSTQHPDNVQMPFFAEDPEMHGEDEVHEAYYAFSHLGCDEQMWDYEGKEVDNFVVKKLLSTYDTYFHEVRLGQDVFLTPRIPNPEIEKSEAKILLETLGSIPRSFDAARLFDSASPPPIFEVILPMTTSAAAINNVYNYYANVFIARQNVRLPGTDLTIREWLGEFRPERINVIPLFESTTDMLSAPDVMKTYLSDKDFEHQRVFLARSDPAMNFGMVSTVLANKVTLRRLEDMAHQLGVALYPIIGLGTAPFRGGLSPYTVAQVAAEYPSVATFTIQSAFKFDYPPAKVTAAIQQLKDTPLRPAPEIDTERALMIMEKYTRAYQAQVVELAPVINNVAAYVPRRRKRKLHIGLFGYSRNVNGIHLPRAIGFTAALYSIGLPPELLGLNALDKSDIAFVRENYMNFDSDLQAALRFANPRNNRYFPRELKDAIDAIDLPVDCVQEHCDISAKVLDALKNNQYSALDGLILRAAYLRRFLG
jgi:phosphoenolpyruvate carboxylase